MRREIMGLLSMNLNYEVANILINRARNNQITDYQELTEYILCFNDSESIKRLIKELPFDTKQHVARCMVDMGETERVNGFINTIKNEKQYVKKFAQNSIANNNITAPPDIIYTAVKNGFIDENDLSQTQRNGWFKHCLKNDTPTYDIPNINMSLDAIFSDIPLSKLVNYYADGKISNSFLLEIIKNTSLNKTGIISFDYEDKLEQSFRNYFVNQQQFKDMFLIFDIFKEMKNRNMDDAMAESYSLLETSNLLLIGLYGSMKHNDIRGNLQKIRDFKKKRKGKYEKLNQEIIELKQELYLPVVNHLVDRLKTNLNELSETISKDVVMVNSNFKKVLHDLKMLVKEVPDISIYENESIDLIDKMYSIENYHRDTMAYFYRENLLNLVFHRIADSACKNEKVKQYFELKYADKIKEVHDHNFYEISGSSEIKDIESKYTDLVTFKIDKTDSLPSLVTSQNDIVELSKQVDKPLIFKSGIAGLDNWCVIKLMQINKFKFEDLKIEEEYLLTLYMDNFEPTKEHISTFIDMAEKDLKNGLISKEDYEKIVSMDCKTSKANKMRTI